MKPSALISFKMASPQNTKSKPLGAIHFSGASSFLYAVSIPIAILMCSQYHCHFDVQLMSLLCVCVVNISVMFMRSYYYCHVYVQLISLSF
jgi:hypothetical protein